jgi:glyoxylase-like metal-dependent hydrolase (beta-lactamase superfamily II)
MTMEQIGANIFAETVYPGVNVGCILTDEGAVCVDTPLLPGEAQRWRALIYSLGGEVIRFVVYTNGQRERILGTQYLISERQAPYAEQLAPAGQPVARPWWTPFPPLASTTTAAQSKPMPRSTVVAHTAAWDLIKDHQSEGFKQSLIDLFADRDPDIVNLGVVLPQITFDRRTTLRVGDVTVILLAATKGTVWVWLPDQHALFAGDTVVVGTHPPLHTSDIREWLEALERLRSEPQLQDAVIVPGRGPVCDVSATQPLTRYLCMAFDRTQQVYQAGRPKAELNDVAVELLPLYPVIDGQRERVQRQIKLALDNLYDTFKTADVDLA